MTYRKINIDFLENFIGSIFEKLDFFKNISVGWMTRIYSRYYGKIIITNDTFKKDITFTFIDIYKDNRKDFINDLQECSVCFEDTKHLTPCFHPVCKDCEDKLITNFVPLVCPICRSTKFPGNPLKIRFPHKAYKQLFRG